jgi:SagB-type dehydrogenase family enzyme
MIVSFFLSLREGASIAPHGAGQTVIQAGPWSATFSGLSTGTLTALRRLGSTGEYEDRLTEIVLETDGTQALAAFYFHLHHLSQWGLLHRSIFLNGDRIATLVPISFYFEYSSRSIARDSRYMLSRFAYMRTEGGTTMLESPLSHARIILHDCRAAAFVHFLAKPRRVDEWSQEATGLSLDAPAQLMTLMLRAQMLTELTKSGRSLEDDNPSLRSWEFHDLLFHSRSREGRHDHAIGGTYRFVGQFDPPPALNPVCSDKVIPLRPPDLERQKREDPPLALVQETRCSIREYDAKSITLEQLSEFLYRVGRMTRSEELKISTPHGPIRMQYARRPYPGGGALYELELYLAVTACENLAAGLYHYDARDHQLERVSDVTSHVQGLLLRASQSTGISNEHLQVLIIIAARFQRMSWKYASMAYAATLKHVGVLYQTMYLVATAMQLAPCGIGCGDADLFARAAGTNYYDETSVGEFLLGSKRTNPLGQTL